MTSDEYRQLIEFLGRQFTEVDRRFDQVDGRFSEVDRRFDQVDGRLAEVDRRFDQVDGRFAEVDRRFDQVDGRLAEVDRRFDQVDGRFGGVDTRSAGFDARFADIAHWMVRIDGRITALQQQMDERFAEVLGHFDEIYRRLERLEQEYHAITQALRRIETWLADEGGRREIIERDLAQLKQHVAALQVRIEEIEQRLRS